MNLPNLINAFLRKAIGYQLVRFDTAPYVFRERLVEFIEHAHPTGKMLDIGAARWSYAKERFGAEQVTTLDLVPPADVIGSVMELPFASETFDTVLCFETLEHVTDPFKAMSEMHRVLKPGGQFIGSAPFTYELHGEEYGDYWRYTRQGWEKLLATFSDIEITPYAGTKNAPVWYFVRARK